MYFDFGKTHFVEFQFIKNKIRQPLSLCVANCHAPLTDKIDDAVVVQPFPYSLDPSVLNYVSKRYV